MPEQETPRKVWRTPAGGLLIQAGFQLVFSFWSETVPFMISFIFIDGIGSNFLAGVD